MWIKWHYSVYSLNIASVGGAIAILEKAGHARGQGSSDLCGSSV